MSQTNPTCNPTTSSSSTNPTLTIREVCSEFMLNFEARKQTGLDIERGFHPIRKVHRRLRDLEEGRKMIEGKFTQISPQFGKEIMTALERFHNIVYQSDTNRQNIELFKEAMNALFPIAIKGELKEIARICEYCSGVLATQKFRLERDQRYLAMLKEVAKAHLLDVRAKLDESLAPEQVETAVNAEARAEESCKRPRADVAELDGVACMDKTKVRDKRRRLNEEEENEGSSVQSSVCTTNSEADAPEGEEDEGNSE